MATLGTTAVTLMDFKTRSVNEKIAPVIEILTDTNEILEDIPWMPCNKVTSHLTTVRTGLPEGEWRKYNQGVSTDKSTTRQHTDSTGMLEVYAEVDKALADLNGNTAAWRLSEDKAFIQGLNNQMSETLFYGNTDTYSERFLGFDPRFDVPSSNEDFSGFNIINGGGTGSDNTSIWLIGWGDNTVHGLYPSNIEAGLTVDDLGEQTLLDANNKKYQGYRTHYKWNCGLTIRDWRYVVRICNVDVSNLVADSSAADLVNLMVEATERVPNLTGAKFAFYCHRTVRSALRKQIRKTSNVNLTLETVSGRPVTMFDGIPVRRCDAILKTESAISGTFGS